MYAITKKRKWASKLKSQITIPNKKIKVKERGVLMTRVANTPSPTTTPTFRTLSKHIAELRVVLVFICVMYTNMPTSS